MRVFWGVVTLGASELACGITELTSDFASQGFQLASLYHLLISNKNPLYHFVDQGYLDPVAEGGSSRSVDPLCAPIWLPRFEQLGRSACP